MIVDDKYLKEAEKIAKFFDRPDWVQGGGGNFSIKLNKELMLIKASGFSFGEISRTEGLVVVNQAKTKKYFLKILKNKFSLIQENLSNQKIAKLTFNFLPDKKLKASIETGFHSFLGKYVVHTHSVYANLVNCSAKPEELLKKIFKNSQDFVFVKYQNPGLNLTKGIKREVTSYFKLKKTLPKVIFLKNHGLIVNGQTLAECFDVYLKFDRALKKYFKLLAYPRLKIVNRGEVFLSQTVFLKKYLKTQADYSKIFDPILFPDQVVYLNGKIKKLPEGIIINEKILLAKNNFSYRASLKESKTIEEIILAYFYLRYILQKNNLKFTILSRLQANFIKNMDSEKYRKALLNE